MSLGGETLTLRLRSRSWERERERGAGGGVNSDDGEKQEIERVGRVCALGGTDLWNCEQADVEERAYQNYFLLVSTDLLWFDVANRP